MLFVLKMSQLLVPANFQTTCHRAKKSEKKTLKQFLIIAITCGIMRESSTGKGFMVTRKLVKTFYRLRIPVAG